MSWKVLTLWMVTLVGCVASGLQRDNPANCVVNPAVCQAGQSCNLVTEVCAASPTVIDGLCSDSGVCWENPLPQGGTIDLRALDAMTATAAVNAGGDIYVRPRTSLTAAVNSGGDIHYSGNPQVSMAVSGGGDVRRDN